MKRVIVTTTINPPTEAIERFDSMSGWTLIVAGDLKTPRDYKLKNGMYLSPAEQEKYNQELSDLIGWGCIQRRNFAFLMAKELGAELIATVDDDNVPMENWGKNILLDKESEVNLFDTEQPVFDPISVTNFPHLWQRGFPIELIHARQSRCMGKTKIKAHIQADLCNGDPDVDALARIVLKPNCEFDPKPFPLSSRKLAPFSSQNTFFTRNVLPHYFMVPHIGRMDDIWASYHVQSLGFSVVFCAPSVVQIRNSHDLVSDLKSEIFGLENTLSLVTSINSKKYHVRNFWPERAIRAFEVYQRCFSNSEFVSSGESCSKLA